VSAAEGAYWGQRPATLRLIRRADGAIRFQIEGPGFADAMVDIPRERARELLADLEVLVGEKP
jgi:hypothetical protein